MSNLDKNTYFEDNSEEFGVSHIWKDATIVESLKTQRGTLVEMVERPGWGLACYMDNSIQSCTIDERIYHEALVHPALASVKDPKRVCIFGGGEGATAREVLKMKSVEKVDMYEWDVDVVNLFKKYPQWSNNAWDDTRLSICYIDVFEAIKHSPSEKYDIVIIDLFEPCDENLDKWSTLLRHVNDWVSEKGSIVMYAGMRNISASVEPYMKLLNILDEYDEWHGIPLSDMSKDVIPYRVYIPSFSGESMFLLIKPTESKLNYNTFTALHSRINKKIWKSYKTLNW
jgi:spermidine synthase